MTKPAEYLMMREILHYKTHVARKALLERNASIQEHNDLSRRHQFELKALDELYSEESNHD